MPAYSSCALLARREAFDRVGPFDTSWQHASETEWLMRCADRGLRHVVLPDVLVFRRLHERNRSTLNVAASKAEYVSLIKARLDRRRPSTGRSRS